MRFFGVQIPFTREKRDSWPPSVADDRYFTPNHLPFTVAAGVAVSAESVLRITAAYCAVRIISESIASLPIVTYKRLAKGGKDRAVDHSLFHILKTAPNAYMTSFRFRELMMNWVLLRGNAYSKILKNKGGDVIGLWPLHPSLVRVVVNNSSDDQQVNPGDLISYKYRPDPRRPEEIDIPRDQMFHLMGLSDNGFEGLSVISAHREAFGLSLATETYAASFFGNNATPGGFLSLDGEMEEQDKEQFRKDWNKSYRGPANAGKVAVLEYGMKWVPMGVSPKDSLYLDARRFQIEEIARIFRVPPHKLADITRGTAGGTSLEQQSMEFVTDALTPWLRRWEETITRSLIVESQQEDIFAEFLLDGLLRGDTTARYAAYNVGRMGGWLNVNEIREKENINPIGPEGDVYLAPLNMVDAAHFEDVTALNLQKGLAQQPKGVGSQPSDGTDKTEKPHANKNSAFRFAYSGAWERIIRKEVASMQTAAKKENFADWLTDFREKHRSFALECLKDVTLTYIQMGGIVDLRKLVDEYVGSIGADAERCKMSERELSDHWCDRTLGLEEEEYDKAA